MKRVCLSIVVVWLLASFVFAQGTQQAPAPSPSNAQASASGTSEGNDVKLSFPAVLERGLDSKKLKEGDPVVCETTGTLRGRNGFLIPSGSKVIGHVTQAQARGKGDANSTLGMTFDKIQTKGKEIAMTGTLQAIAPSLGSSGPMTSAAPPSLGGGGTASAGGAGAGTTAAPATSMKVSGPSTGTPLVVGTSAGVLGIKGLEMDANGLITSSGKQVKLDNGTQMMIRAEIQMPVE